MDSYRFFATCPKGLELLLVAELQALGASCAAEKRAGVSFSGDLALAYRACLWSRLANRILLPLAQFQATDANELYQGVQTIHWAEHLAATGSLAVDFSSSQSQLTHTHFGAQKTKDAIVDQLRTATGSRPRVELERPDIRVNVYLHKNLATVSLDLSGESLHKRGYRSAGGYAPLKENLAAAILLRANWPSMAAAQKSCIDPLCGSATLLIEAALMAADSAPGLGRDYFGFLAWQQHPAELWEALIEEASARRQAGLSRLTHYFGYDNDPKIIEQARINIEQAGLSPWITVQARSLQQFKLPAAIEPGLMVTNPPYGERLGDKDTLSLLYAELAEAFKHHAQHWRAAVITAIPELGKQLGYRARKRYQLFNGALACTLLLFELEPEWRMSSSALHTNRKRIALAQQAVLEPAQMFANRLRKNYKHLQKWAQQQGINCYRLYDADLPEYALAIDKYHHYLHVQEYAAPKTVAPEKAHARLQAALAVLPEVLAILPEHIFFKVRAKQQGSKQYQKLASHQDYYPVQECNARFLVNLSDYLDSGLFLDHRPTRHKIQSLAKGKHFLNLFAYTGTATVHAALGQAASTTSVDLSAVYLQWAKKNMALNDLEGPQHQFIQADCLSWLKQETRRYELIFLDPPTFSNSKRMQQHLDIQRDHIALINLACQRLTHDGLLIFSTNKQGFKLAHEQLSHLQIKDISSESIPLDFARQPKIHQCWEIKR